MKSPNELYKDEFCTDLMADTHGYDPEATFAISAEMGDLQRFKKGISLMIDALEQEAPLWKTCKHKYYGHKTQLCINCLDERTTIEALEFFNTGATSSPT